MSVLFQYYLMVLVVTVTVSSSANHVFIYIDQITCSMFMILNIWGVAVIHSLASLQKTIVGFDLSFK